MSGRLLDVWLGRQRVGRRPDRREALALGLGSLAAILTGCASKPRRGEGRRVLVVGAGLSGLSTALSLRDAGAEVLVMEARDRVGGRAFTVRHQIVGRTVEAGGELFGSNHGIAIAYAERFGIGWLDVEDPNAPVGVCRLGDRTIRGAELERLQAECDEILGHLTEMARSVDADAPWRSPDAEALDRASLAQWLAELRPSADAGRLIRALLEADNGVAAESQSLLANLAQIRGGGLERFWDETEVWRAEGGSDRFAAVLADAIGRDRIRLGTPVTRITQDGRRVTVEDVRGTREEGDALVLAVPPPLWSTIVMDPPVLGGLSVPMGLAVKSLSTVRDAYWRSAGGSVDSASDGPVSFTWEGTYLQPESPTGQCALVTFSGGPAAEAARAASAVDRDGFIQREVEPLVPGFGAAFVSGRFIDWPGDPWTRAGYSFPSPGSLTTVHRRLHEGFGRVHLAGEHLCTAFPGFMEGAMRAGVVAAARVLASD